MMRRLKSLIRDSLFGLWQLATRLAFGFGRAGAAQLPAGGLLVVKIDALGDLLILWPELRQLRRGYGGKITLLLSAGNRDLGQRWLALGLIDELLIVNRRKLMFNLPYRLQWLWQLSRRRFASVVSPVFSRDSLVEMLLFAGRWPTVFGVAGNNDNVNRYLFPASNNLYTDLAAVPAEAIVEADKNRYVIRRFLSHSGSAVTDCAAEQPLCDWISEDDWSAATELLAGAKLLDRRFCVIFPGAGSLARVWPRQRFAQVIRHIKDLGIEPVVCGSANERLLLEEIKQHLDFPVSDLVGRTSIFVLAAVLKKSAFYFGSETGIMHLANLLAVPTVVLMGGGYFDRFAPSNNPERNLLVFDESMPCKNDSWRCAAGLLPGQSAPCIMAIGVDKALAAINRIMTNLNQPAGSLN